MITQLLQERISGTIVHREDRNYESVRHSLIWNELKPERFPDLIVQVACEDDVIEIVKFARRQQMKIAVRGGGHSWCASPLQESGILIDLSSLNQVNIDPQARIATVQPVVSNRDFIEKLAEYNLAFPVGHCPSVPLSGFILAGGLGWNAGEWGISCFSLLSLDIVTAEGKLITATETENQELFWAARGAGAGFFGVITKYRLKLYSLPQAITSSTLMYPLEQLSEVVKWSQEIGKILPKNVEFTMSLAKAPPSVMGQDKVCILSATAFADSQAEANKALSVFTTCPIENCVMKNLNVSTPFETLFERMDEFFPEGKRYAADNLWSDAPPLDVLTKVQKHFNQVPSADSLILFLILPPDALPLTDAAFSMMASLYVLCYSIWETKEEDEANTLWLRNLMNELEPLAMGHYIGESDIVANPYRVNKSFKQFNWEHLQGLQKKYDPNGIFYSYTGLNPK